RRHAGTADCLASTGTGSSPDVPGSSAERAGAVVAAGTGAGTLRDLAHLDPFDTGRRFHITDPHSRNLFTVRDHQQPVVRNPIRTPFLLSTRNPLKPEQRSFESRSGRCGNA